MFQIDEPRKRSRLPALAVVGGIASAGACGLSVALLGLGLPFAVCALLSGLCVGLLIYAYGRWTPAADPEQTALPEQAGEPDAADAPVPRPAAR